MTDEQFQQLMQRLDGVEAHLAELEKSNAKLDDTLGNVRGLLFLLLCAVCFGLWRLVFSA